MALTQKREAFVLAYLKLGVAAKAYVESHDAANMTPATIRKRAAELLKLPEVQARIAELRGASANAAVLDRADVLRDLQRVVRIALGDETVRRLVMKGRGKEAQHVEVEARMVDLSAACRGLELLGKSDEIRLFVERHEHTGEDGMPLPEASPREVARAIMGLLRDARLSDAPAQTAPADDEEPEEPDSDGGLASRGSPAARDLAAAVAAVGRSPSPAAAASPPHPRPETLEPGERELQDNGAEVILDLEFARFAVRDASGRLVGYRADLDAARELAAKQKPAPEAKERR